MLKSTSSTVELVGEFKSYDNGIYTIETDLGQLEVDARTVTCIGDDCPEIESLVSEFIMSGSQNLINQLLVPLLEGYSFSLDASVKTTVLSDTEANITISAKEGRKFADISVQSDGSTQQQNALVINSGAPDILSKDAGKARVIPIAADAMVAITSDTNTVKSISLAALRGVLSGAITNWKNLGGPDVNINVYLPQTTSGLARVAKTMGFDISKIVATERFDDLNELSKTTANDPYGLGFTSFSNRRTANLLPIIGSCGANVRPNVFNIASGSYPATFYHYLEVDTDTLPIFAREFISYLDSTQAKSMIERQGYPSLSVFETDFENQGNRIVHGLLTAANSVQRSGFRTMLDTLKAARQLSTVFRFNADGITLDPQSKAAFDALISELLLGGFADQKMMVVGFTGAENGANENKIISLDAAKQVAGLIKAADSDGLLSDLQIETLGLGEASPLACEDTAKGIAINNRVEIWVKNAL